MGKYNLTQLEPFKAIERGIVHRDMIAHVLRWSHVLKIAKIGMNILDFGCGSGNLYEVFYRNRYSPKEYIGLDIRKKIIEKNKIKFPKALWYDEDLVNMKKHYSKNWDIITSFEVLEHINKKNGDKFMQNIKNHCNENTIVLMSTPCYNENVGAAKNHIYDGQIQEYTFNETKTLFEKYFKINKVYGTFASQKDYKNELTVCEQEMFNKLNEYYDTNLISVIFAPLHPEHSRNCIWSLSI